MKYSIAFKNLPFEPEMNQVIYVESNYDERINAIIRNKYDLLKLYFKRYNLDFIYLPMFFDDKEIKEKVLYYAPYLTSEIIEKVELRSSFILGYMSHLENQDKVLPSFLFSPWKNDEEWVFEGKTIDIVPDAKDHVIIEWFDDAILDIANNLPIDFYGEVKDEMGSTMCSEPIPILYPDEEPDVEQSSTPNFREGAIRDDKPSIDSSTSDLDEIREEDVNAILEDLEKKVAKLRLIGIPLATILEFISKYETVSRLLITEDLRIILPEYNNKEVEMGALCKAIYFLFINHPEGIVLQQLEDYHHELVNYYCRTSNRTTPTDRMVETINRLEYPGDNSINVNLSRIKAAFIKAFDKHLVKHYIVTGQPGEPYKISLDKLLIEWEDE